MKSLKNATSNPLAFPLPKLHQDAKKNTKKMQKCKLHFLPSPAEGIGIQQDGPQATFWSPKAAPAAVRMPRPGGRRWRLVQCGDWRPLRPSPGRQPRELRCLQSLIKPAKMGSQMPGELKKRKNE